MAQALGGYSSYPSLVQYVIDCWIAQTDSANNRSLVSANAYVYVSGSSASSSGGSGDIYINGSGNGGSIGYFSLGRYGTVGVVSHSVWVSHDANGQLGSVGFSGSSSMAGLGSASASGSLSGFPDYDRRPSSPTFASITRSTSTLSVSVNTVSSPAGTPTYYIQRSENGGAWGDTRTGTSASFSSLTFGTSQQFRAYATNSDGQSDITYSGVYSIPNIPSAPASISVSPPSALSCIVTSGSASDGGAGITAYYVQASADNGSTWATAQLMSSQTYTFTGLTPGATYKFRTYAVNEMGSGPYAVSASTFVPAGGKRWTGTAWQATGTAKRWNGTAWIDLTTAKRFNGTSWQDLS